MLSSQESLNTTLAIASLRRIHHIGLYVRDMNASRHFYGGILGLHELTGDELPEAWVELVATGEATFLVTPDGTLINLFCKPDLAPPDPDPHRTFTRVNHLAFDIDPQFFDYTVEVLRQHQVTIDRGPISRPTGRGIYIYDPDGFLIEIRCDPMNA
jgi:glyoxylase I family protein